MLAPEVFTELRLNPGKKSAAAVFPTVSSAPLSERGNAELAEASAPIPSAVAFFRSSRRAFSVIAASLPEVSKYTLVLTSASPKPGLARIRIQDRKYDGLKAEESGKNSAVVSPAER